MGAWAGNTDLIGQEFGARDDKIWPAARGREHRGAVRAFFGEESGNSRRYGGPKAGLGLVGACCPPFAARGRPSHSWDFLMGGAVGWAKPSRLGIGRPGQKKPGFHSHCVRSLRHPRLLFWLTGGRAKRKVEGKLDRTWVERAVCDRAGMQGVCRAAPGRTSFPITALPDGDPTSPAFSRTLFTPEKNIS